ncbi:MAG: DUF6454 family protein [Acidobacteriia bacterium]|nr:DUF6454 family protein [Terriglobia bacterium]
MRARTLARTVVWSITWSAFAQPAARELSGMELAGVTDLKGTVYHVQGIDFDEQSVWVTSVDAPNQKGYLHEYSSSGELRRSIEIQDGVRFHPGGIASDGSSFWVPIAEYRAHSTTVVQRRNKKTLEVEYAFEVPDHIGCIAVTPEYLIGGNWDSKDFYVWDHEGRLIRKVPSGTQTAYQDMKYEDGFLVASGLRQDGTGSIDWLMLPSFEITRQIRAGKTDRGVSFTREGMAIHGSRLVLLPEDGPARMFIFQLGR